PRGRRADDPCVEALVGRHRGQRRPEHVPAGRGVDRGRSAGDAGSAAAPAGRGGGQRQRAEVRLVAAVPRLSARGTWTSGEGPRPTPSRALLRGGVVPDVPDMAECFTSAGNSPNDTAD